MTDVTIYAAPLPEGPEASHRLLRRAAARGGPPRAACPHARAGPGKAGVPAAPGRAGGGPRPRRGPRRS